MVEKITAARVVAPEDIRVGSYVMLQSTTCEYARWACEPGAGVQITRVRWTAGNGQRPCRVVGACLPFVLVENEKGDTVMYDTRNVSFLRVKRSFAELAWERARRTERRDASRPDACNSTT